MNWLKKIFSRKKNTTKTSLEIKKIDDCCHLNRLKMLLIFVQKGYASTINRLLIKNHIVMIMNFFAEGTGTKDHYVMDLLDVKEKNKDAILAIVNENKYLEIRDILNLLFTINTEINGIVLVFNISILINLFVYRFLSHHGVLENVGKRK